MKKIIALLMAFLMVASMVACGGKDKDNEITIYSENAIVDAFAKLIDQISNNGGYVSISTEGDLLAPLDVKTNDLSVSGFDMIIDKNQAELGIIGKYNGKDITDTVFLSNKALVLNSPTLLGGAYGIDFTTCDKDWESSYLNPKNGSEYAIPQEAIDSINQLISMLKNNNTSSLPGVNIEKTSEAITKFADKLIAEAGKVIPVSQKTEGKYTIKSVKITLDDMGKLLNVIANTLEKDKEFQAAMNSIIANSGSTEASAIPFDQIIATLRSATDSLTAFAPADGEINIVISYKCNKENTDKTFVIGIEIKQAGEKATLAFGINDLMTNTKKEFTHTISTDFECTGYFDQMMAQDADFADVLSAVKGFKYQTVWNKENGKLQIKITAMGQSIIMDANMKFNVTQNGNMELIFKFEKLVVGELFNSEDIIKAPITLKLSTEKPRALSIPKYDNILKNESVIEKITAHVQKEFGELIGEPEDSYKLAVIG